MIIPFEYLIDSLRDNKPLILTWPDGRITRFTVTTIKRMEPKTLQITFAIENAPDFYDTMTADCTYHDAKNGRFASLGNFRQTPTNDGLTEPERVKKRPRPHGRPQINAEKPSKPNKKTTMKGDNKPRPTAT